jgi:hypothetical protein
MNLRHSAITISFRFPRAYLAMNESNFPSVDLADYDALFSEFISYPDLENNNDEQSILHTSTPLGLSDLHLAHGTAEQATSAASLNLSVELHTSSTQITSLIQDPPFDLTRRTTPSPHLRQTLQQKRPLSSDAQNSSSDLPGLNCWSLSGGNVPARQPRSCFSKMRRIEVKHMRDLGACLRCRRLKRSVGLSYVNTFIVFTSSSARAAIHVSHVHVRLTPQLSLGV